MSSPTLHTSHTLSIRWFHVKFDAKKMGTTLEFLGGQGLDAPNIILSLCIFRKCLQKNIAQIIYVYNLSIHTMYESL